MNKNSERGDVGSESTARLSPVEFSPVEEAPEKAEEEISAYKMEDLLKMNIAESKEILAKMPIEDLKSLESDLEEDLTKIAPQEERLKRKLEKVMKKVEELIDWREIISDFENNIETQKAELNKDDYNEIRVTHELINAYEEEIERSSEISDLDKSSETKRTEERVKDWKKELEGERLKDKNGKYLKAKETLDKLTAFLVLVKPVPTQEKQFQIIDKLQARFILDNIEKLTNQFRISMEKGGIITLEVKSDCYQELQNKLNELAKENPNSFKKIRLEKA